MKPVYIDDVSEIIAALKREALSLNRGVQIELIGGLKERGFTSHDVDISVDLPLPCLDPEDEIFGILNKYGNIIHHKFKLELDVTFLYENECLYKLDEHGFIEVNDAAAWQQ
jgi:hypothetical protein